MTENEAREILQARQTCDELELLSCTGKGCDMDCDKCNYNYAQGTMWERREALGIVIKSLEEIQQYRAIGTVEEFKALKEKSEPKKMIEREEFGFEIYRCPACYAELYSGQAHCDDCGQAISNDYE